MEAKYEEVSAWLAELFGGQRSVCEFEINTQTIDYLYEACQEYKRRTKENLVLAEEFNRRAAQYSKEGKQLKRVLGSAGFAISEHGTTTQTSKPLAELVERAKDVAQLAILLETPETDSATQMSAMAALQHKRSQLRQARKDQASKLEEIRTASQAVSEMKASLKRLQHTYEDADQSQKPLTADRVANLRYLENKSKEYTATVASLKEQIKRSGVTPELYHSALVQLAEQEKQLENDLALQQSKLETYKHLPPDNSLAKLKIEETKLQLQQLDDKLSQTVSNLQLRSME